MDLVDQLNMYLQAKSGMAFLIAFLGGILASFTPCVYPMIPVTIAYIGGKSGKSKSHGFFLSLAYVGGLAVVYSSLGAIAAITGKAFGEFAQTPIVYFSVGIIFILLALGMLDVFSIPTPGFLSGLQTKKVGGGYVGAFFIGAIAGLVASPCLTPILGGLLVFAAQKQNVLFGILLLFTFSLGLGILFIVLGTFAGLISSLPKAGKWMDWIKKGFGYVLILVAVYFFFVSGKMSVKPDDYTAPVPLPVSGDETPVPVPDKTKTGSSVVTLNQPAPDFRLKDSQNKDVALSSYKGKIVLLDFWTTWCKPCWKAIPELKKMQSELQDKGFTIISILMDKNAAGLLPGIAKKAKLNYPFCAGTSELQQAYKVRGFPTFVIIDRDGIVKQIYLGGGREKSIHGELVKLLGDKPAH